MGPLTVLKSKLKTRNIFRKKKTLALQYEVRTVHKPNYSKCLYLLFLTIRVQCRKTFFGLI
jgi:hypothetical protein